MRIVFPFLIASFIIAAPSLTQKVFADTPAQPIELQDKYKNVNINIVKTNYEDAKDVKSRFNILNKLEKYNIDNKDVLLFLGDAYSRIAGVPTDISKAVIYYNKSAGLGNLWALIRLGDLDNDGILVPHNSNQAFSYFKMAADKGLPFAKLRLGNAYLSGSGVNADIAEGLRLIKESAETGDKWALMKLGDLYRWGDYVAIDGGASVDFYKSAAIAGNDDALIRLGEIYRDGIVIPKDALKSISYFKQAADHGMKRSNVLLGQNHIWKKFGHLSDPEKGMRLLIEACKTNEPSAAPALAGLYMNGSHVARNPKHAIRILTKAANAGNASAATLLLSYYRDGKKSELLQDIKKAKETFQSYQALYTPSERIRQDIILQSASARSTKDYTKIVKLLNKAPTSIQSETLATLRNVNVNAFVFMVQERLKQRGLYNGRANGRLTTATILSINALCKQSVAASKCKQGPLHPIAVRLVSILLQ